MSRGLQAEETAPQRANPDPDRPEPTLAGASASVEDQRLNTGGYRVSLPMFEGPLDLLLHLVQKHELDILNIPIAFITERYVEYIQLLDELNIDLASEYLVMAATLVHIKSRMLLPNAAEDESGDGTEEDELDPRAELVRRLLEYQKYKLAAEQLGERTVLGRDVFPRGSSDEMAGGEAPLEAIATFKLLDAFQAVLERTQKTREHQIDFERFSLSERISELSDLLRRRRRLVFHEIFSERASRAELIITFLALLEMTRLRLTRLRQEGPLEPIYIELTVADEELPPEEESAPEDTLSADDVLPVEDRSPEDGTEERFEDVEQAAGVSQSSSHGELTSQSEPVEQETAPDEAPALVAEPDAPEQVSAVLEPAHVAPEDPAAEPSVGEALVGEHSDAEASTEPELAEQSVEDALRSIGNTDAADASDADASDADADADAALEEQTLATDEPGPSEPAGLSAIADELVDLPEPVQEGPLEAASDPEAASASAPNASPSTASPSTASPCIASQPEPVGQESSDEARALVAELDALEQARVVLEPAHVAPEDSAAEPPVGEALAAEHPDAEASTEPELAEQSLEDDSRSMSSAADAAATTTASSASATPEEQAPAAGEPEPRLAADPREYE